MDKREGGQEMDRLDGLFRYLNLLNQVHGACGSESFTAENRILKTCKEIEKELGIEEPSYNINVEAKIKNQQKVTNEMIERALKQFPKI
jgi:hypothetical protein